LWTVAWDGGAERVRARECVEEASGVEGATRGKNREDGENMVGLMTNAR